MENQINEVLQSAAPELGAVQENEASVRFTEAFWAWLRRERARAPTAEEIGITDQQAGAIVRQIMNTEEYRKLRL